MNVSIQQPNGEAVCGTVVRTDDGREIPFVKAVTWRHEVGSLPVAEVELAMVGVNVAGQLRAYCGGKEVRRIEFEDGTVEEFPAEAKATVEVTHMSSPAREFIEG